MYKEIGLIIMVGLLFSFVGFNPFRTIIIEEPAVAGQEFLTHVNLRNDLSSNVGDVSVRMFIYDLGLVFYSSEFDIADRDGVGLWVFGELSSNVPPGDYLVRVTASNDHFRDVRHVYITII